MLSPGTDVRALGLDQAPAGPAGWFFDHVYVDIQRSTFIYIYIYIYWYDVVPCGHLSLRSLVCDGSAAWTLFAALSHASLHLFQSSMLFEGGGGGGGGDGG